MYWYQTSVTLENLTTIHYWPCIFDSPQVYSLVLCNEFKVFRMWLLVLTRQKRAKPLVPKFVPTLLQAQDSQKIHRKCFLPQEIKLWQEGKWKSWILIVLTERLMAITPHWLSGSVSQVHQLLLKISVWEDKCKLHLSWGLNSPRMYFQLWTSRDQFPPTRLHLLMVFQYEFKCTLIQWWG